MAVKPAAAKAKRICNRNRSLEAWRPGGSEARRLGKDKNKRVFLMEIEIVFMSLSDNSVLFKRGAQCIHLRL